MTIIATALLIGADEGEPGLNPVGGRIVRRASSAATAGAYTLFENNMPAHSAGPLPHIHHRHDEAFFVLEGALVIKGGTQTVEAPAGAHIFVPRGLVHQPSNPHGKPARFLLLFSPGGMDEFFVDAARDRVPMQAASTDPEALARLAAFSARYGFEIAEFPNGSADHGPVNSSC